MRDISGRSFCPVTDAVQPGFQAVSQQCGSPGAVCLSSDFLLFFPSQYMHVKASLENT